MLGNSSGPSATYGDLTLYNSLSGSYNLVPISESTDKDDSQGSHVSSRGLAWYTCGPTVYDSAHLGHARTYVTLDIIKRALLHNYESQLERLPPDSDIPPPPMFIMNITDVDDKILARALERKISPLKLARDYEEEFWQDMDELNIMRPTIVTRVTEHVESSIIPYIQKIMNNGMAYVMNEDDDDICQENDREGYGSVYFDVRAFESTKGSINKYGKLSSNQPASDDNFFRLGHDNDANEEGGEDESLQRKRKKRDPRDFVLWKSRTSGDEEENDYSMHWDSPWGKGRPGWHIECSAMIDRTMDEFKNYDIRVHAGGVDLKFPHHTNEIAQAEAYRAGNIAGISKEWIPHWVHTGHLHIDGLKMSKSLKNFVTIREMLKPDEEVLEAGNGNAKDSLNTIGHESSFSSPSDDFRLWCLGLSGSYRGPATYSKARLIEAKVTRQKILRFLIDGEQWVRRKRDTANMVLEGPSTSIWSHQEHDLLRKSSACRVKCERALRGLDNSCGGKNLKAAFDFDGSSYLSSLIDLSEASSEYIAKNNDEVNRPTFPVERSISVLRKCLSIAGFSEKTTRAGLLSPEGSKSHNIHGGEEKLVEELVRFRSFIRKTALENMKTSKQAKPNVDNGYGNDDASIKLSKELLAECDNLRDDRLPSIGLEIFDVDRDQQWRFCMPHASKGRG